MSLTRGDARSPARGLVRAGANERSGARHVCWSLAALASLLAHGLSAPASATPAVGLGARASAQAAADRTLAARAAFRHGARLARRGRWADAIAEFGRSYELRPHPVTSYNLGFSERAIGRYTRSVKYFARALREDRLGHRGQLSSHQRSASVRYLRELNRHIGRVEVSAAPGTLVGVDGRPAERRLGRPSELLVGTLDVSQPRQPADLPRRSEPTPYWFLNDHTDTTPRLIRHQLMRFRTPITALVLLAGCGQLIGDDGFAVEDLGPHHGMFGDAAAECVACAETACGEQLSTCERDPECAELGRCFAEGFGPARRAACYGLHPGVAPAHLAVGTCVGQSCTAPCGNGHIWSCLDERVPATQPVKPTFQVRLRLFDVVNQQPLSGLSVRACSRVSWSDPDCASNLNAADTSDASGVAQLDLRFPLLAARQPWDGFFLIDAPAIYPDLAVYTQPLTAGVEVAVPIVTRGSLEQLFRAYGITQAPERGILAASVIDCVGISAAGVRFELDTAGAERFYTTGGLLLDRSATETSADGIVVFTNVSPGKRRLRAFVSATNQLIGEHELYVAAGRRTLAFVEAQQP